MKRLNIKLLIIIISVTLLIGVYKDNKSISPVKIHADTMRYYGKEKKSIFIGNVVAVNDNFTLTADNVTVLFSKDTDVSKIICKGNVNFKTKDIVSMSKEAIVDQTKGEAVLSGGVKVWQGENFLEGEKVIMYYNDSRIVVDKGESSRVTIIFSPEDEKKESTVEPRNKESKEIIP